MTGLGADDFAPTSLHHLHTGTVQKITGRQLSELIELAQHREDWHRLVVEYADPQPPD